MRLSALKHLTDAVQALGHCTQIIVLGSSALLVSFPETGEHGGPLEQTFDADLLVNPCDEQIAAMLHEAVGAGSLFAKNTGYYADILRPEITEKLPLAWETRLVPIETAQNIAALAPEDVVATKLHTARPKDLNLCKYLFTHRLVQPSDVKALLYKMSLQEADIIKAHQRLAETSS